jgi:hypothetical protein
VNGRVRERDKREPEVAIAVQKRNENKQNGQQLDQTRSLSRNSLLIWQIRVIVRSCKEVEHQSKVGFGRGCAEKGRRW